MSVEVSVEVVECRGGGGGEGKSWTSKASTNWPNTIT